MNADPTEIYIEHKAVELYDYVMRFAKQNYKYSEIKQFLVDDGLDETTAKAVISKIPILEKLKAKKDMREAAMVAIFGIVVAVLGFIIPFGKNESIFREVFCGPMIGGIIMFFRAYSKI